MRLIADLETNGLLDTVTTIHCLGIKDIDTGESTLYADHPGYTPIWQGIDRMNNADLIVWHNGTKYDAPVLAKLRPNAKMTWQRQRDTMVLARVIWPEIKTRDLAAYKRGEFPGNLIGLHSLKAWGHRLKNHKGDYDGGWEAFTPAMGTYCLQDLDVTHALWLKIESKNYSPETILLETQVAWILARQERYGFLFDVEAAHRLYSKLVKRKLELEAELVRRFKPLFMPSGKPFTPKVSLKKEHYTKGAPLTKVKLVEFNPTSHDHICLWLTKLYGWKPDEYTEGGKPKMDDVVMAALPYPEAPTLKELLMIEKRIGQLAEGTQAWLKKYNKATGRMHGSVNTNGAVTSRMTHSHPNMGQVVASYSPYGHDMRSLFGTPPGKKLVGADADALELRDLAGYMARYDGGDYVAIVLTGDKKAGTDIHSVNARALGLDPKGFPFGDKESGRDVAKTWFYAWLYGSGDEKGGLILTRKKNNAAAGRAAKASFLTGLPALGQLVKAVKAKAKKTKELRGLDGRVLTVRSDHAALNTLLQSAGAIQMKRALCILDDDLQAAGLVPGIHYEFVANVHDEWQIEVNEDIYEQVGQAAVAAIRKAGEYYSFRCPLAGEWKHGRTWADTH